MLLPTLLVAIWAGYFLVALAAVQDSSTARSLTGLYPIEPTFADIHAILAAIQCNAQGYDTYVANPCDVYGRPHVYGSLWLALGALGVGDWPLMWVGIAVDLAFAGVVLFVLARAGVRRWQEALVWLAALASPPVVLALERANNDLVMFVLIALVAMLVEKGTTVRLVLALLLASVCALLKFYPLIILALPAIVPIAWLHTRPRVLAYAGLCLGVIAATVYEMQKAILVIPHPDGVMAIGGNLLFLPYLDPLPAKILSLGIGALMVVLCAGYRAFHFGEAHDAAVSSGRPGGFTNILFALGGLIVLSTFVVSGSFPYRWIFVLMVLPGLIEVVAHKRPHESNGRVRRAIALLAIASALFVMWYLTIHQFGVRLFPRDLEIAKLKDAASWLFIFCLVYETTYRFAAQSWAMAQLRKWLPSRSPRTLQG